MLINPEKKTKFDFRGFLIKARDFSGNPIGTFSSLNGTVWDKCATVTHRDKAFKRQIAADIVFNDLRKFESLAAFIVLSKTVLVTKFT